MANNSISILIHSIEKMLRTWSHQLMSLILTPFCQAFKDTMLQAVHTYAQTTMFQVKSARLKNAFVSCTCRRQTSKEARHCSRPDCQTNNSSYLKNASLFSHHHLTRPLRRGCDSYFCCCSIDIPSLLPNNQSHCCRTLRFIEANNLQHWNFSSKQIKRKITFTSLNLVGARR